MDRLTRTSIIVSALLFAFLVATLAWNQYGPRPRVWELNEMLREDPVLASYPYDFRVVLFLNGIATVTSPRDAAFSLTPFLASVDPSLAGKVSGAPELTAADDRFRQQEMRAIELLTSQVDVDSVVWSLDKAWYHKHGINLN